MVGEPPFPSYPRGGHEDAHEAVEVLPLEDEDFGAVRNLRREHRLGSAPGLLRPVPVLLRRGGCRSFLSVVVGLTKKGRGGGGRGQQKGFRGGGGGKGGPEVRVNACSTAIYVCTVNYAHQPFVGLDSSCMSWDVQTTPLVCILRGLLPPVVTNNYSCLVSSTARPLGSV